MEDFAFRKRMTIKLDEYLTYLIKVSSKINQDKKVISMDLCDKLLTQSPSMFCDDMYLSLKEEEIDGLLSYVQHFLLYVPYKNFPKSIKVNEFLLHVFNYIVGVTSNDCSIYDEVSKYLRCLSKMSLMDERICGSLSTEVNPDGSLSLFVVRDYLNNSFITGKKVDQEVQMDISDFSDIFTNNIALVDLSYDDESHFILGNIQDNSYWSIVEDQKYPMSSDMHEMRSWTNLVYFLEQNNCAFLKSDFYSVADLQRLIYGVKRYLLLYDVENFNFMTDWAADWWLRQHDFENISCNSIKIYVETLSNLIKRGVLTRSKFFYLFEQNGKKSPELIEAEKKANIVFENICAHMLITRDAIMTTDDVNKGFAKVFSLSSRY